MNTKYLFPLATACCLALNVGCANSKYAFNDVTKALTDSSSRLNQTHNPRAAEMYSQHQLERQKAEAATRLAEERGLPPPLAAPPENDRTWGRSILPSPY